MFVRASERFFPAASPYPDLSRPAPLHPQELISDMPSLHYLAPRAGPRPDLLPTGMEECTFHPRTNFVSHARARPRPGPEAEQLKAFDDDDFYTAALGLPASPARVPGARAHTACMLQRVHAMLGASDIGTSGCLPAAPGLQVRTRARTLFALLVALPPCKSEQEPRCRQRSARCTLCHCMPGTLQPNHGTGAPCQSRALPRLSEPTPPLFYFIPFPIMAHLRRPQRAPIDAATLMRCGYSSPTALFASVLPEIPAALFVFVLPATPDSLCAAAMPAKNPALHSTRLLQPQRASTHHPQAISSTSPRLPSAPAALAMAPQQCWRSGG